MASLHGFLYKTRTLVSRQSSLRRSSIQGQLLQLDRRGFRTSTALHGDPYIPFEGHVPPGLESEEPSSAQERLHQSTITSAEQAVFQRIFDEIAARRQRGESVVGQRRPRAGTARQVKKSNGGEESAFSVTAATGQQPSDPQETLLRFPLALRHAAREAFGLPDETDSASITATPGLQTAGPQTDVRGARAEDEKARRHEAELAAQRAARDAEMEKLRDIVRLPIEAAMASAQTDVALWEVLERDVFPLVERLGIGEPSKPQLPSDSKTRKGSKDAHTQPQPQQTPDLVPLATYGPLLPSLLLEAARRLRGRRGATGDGRASPLLPLLLRALRRKGLPAYILGASPAVFAEVIAGVAEGSGSVGSGRGGGRTGSKTEFSTPVPADDVLGAAETVLALLRERVEGQGGEWWWSASSEGTVSTGGSDEESILSVLGRLRQHLAKDLADGGMELGLAVDGVRDGRTVLAELAQWEARIRKASAEETLDVD